jgi:hypothetical protein
MKTIRETAIRIFFPVPLAVFIILLSNTSQAFSSTRTTPANTVFNMTHVAVNTPVTGQKCKVYFKSKMKIRIFTVSQGQYLDH